MRTSRDPACHGGKADNEERKRRRFRNGFDSDVREQLSVVLTEETAAQAREIRWRQCPKRKDSPMNSGVWFHPNVSTIGSTTERAKRRLRPARCENWSPSGSGARLLVATLASANSPRLAGEWASTHEAHTSHGNPLTGIVVGCCQRRSSGWRYRCARPTQQCNRHTSSRAKLRSPFGESVAAHGRRHHKWGTEGRHGHDLMSRLHRTLA